MKIALNCFTPFSLAHGGAQIQIEQIQRSLQNIGVEAEPLRWWDAKQRIDVIHHCGRMPSVLIDFAHQKGIKVVIAELLTAQGSRTKGQLRFQRFISRTIERFAPATFVTPFSWNSYRLADAVIAMTPWERHLMNYLFGAPMEKIFIVPNGVEEAFLQDRPSERGQWLVCTATITPRKRVVELAEAAVRAQTPLWIIGKAYAESDPYAKQFYALADKNPQWIRRDSPALEDREGLARIYRSARGFVLLSAMETRSLAAEEAAACECPLLLSDLPWARTSWENAAQYAPVTNSVETTARALRAFYDAAPSLPKPPKPPSWLEIGRQLKGIYEKILAVR